jgi:alkylation response protein AidB-like acyl-CoA dehydrogenase
MDFSQSDTERLIQEQTAAFVARHCPRDQVRKWDEDGVFPEELYQ